VVGGGVRVEELDLSIRAYHVLKVLKMDFIEQSAIADFDFQLRITGSEGNSNR